MFLKGFHKTLIYCLFARVLPELSALRLQTEQGDGKCLARCPLSMAYVYFAVYGFSLEQSRASSPSHQIET